MWIREKTQYGGDVVMFLLNKIIKNNKIELSAKKCWPCTCDPDGDRWPPTYSTGSKKLSIVAVS